MTDASYSTAEVARQLGVSIPTIQRWVDLGILKAWKTVGGHRRLDAASVHAFMRDNGMFDASPAAKPAADINTRARSGMLVLIVDDNPDDRDVLEAMIQGALPEARVRTASNGFEALLAIGQEVPRVLVSDIMMPHMNGMEMLRHLNRSLRERPALIVAVSSDSLRSLAHLGALPHGVRFVQKPIDPAVFGTTLQEGLAEAEPAATRPRRR